MQTDYRMKTIDVFGNSNKILMCAEHKDKNSVMAVTAEYQVGDRFYVDGWANSFRDPAEDTSGWK